MNARATFCFKSATLLLLAGIGLGLFMSISEDHAASGAHAHLNLLGWVTMAIFGIYYQLNPDKAAMGVARTHVVLHLAAVLVMTPALVGVLYGRMALVPVVAVASLAVLVDCLLFTYIVFRD